MRQTIRSWVAVLLLLAGVASCTLSDELPNALWPRDLACADRWPSRSIGIQGACSYHGGVIDLNAAQSFWRDLLHGSMNFLGIVCFAWAAGMLAKDNSKSRLD